jgi:hypothetical protein
VAGVEGGCLGDVDLLLELYYVLVELYILQFEELYLGEDFADLLLVV